MRVPERPFCGEFQLLAAPAVRLQQAPGCHGTEVKEKAPSPCWGLAASLPPPAQSSAGMFLLQLLVRAAPGLGNNFLPAPMAGSCRVPGWTGRLSLHVELVSASGTVRELVVFSRDSPGPAFVL